MWKAILNFLSPEIPLIEKEIAMLKPIADHLAQNYATDGNARNALIDTWIQQLQAMKLPSNSKQG
jgi:hypothetical protein